MEIVDTVYLVAYFRPSDPLHRESKEVMEGLGVDRKVSQAALIEFDLLMKSRGLGFRDRVKVWHVLRGIITLESIEPLTPLEMGIASYLAETRDMDYFDSLIAAQCISRSARPLTTDREIIEAVSKREEILRSVEDLWEI